MKMFSGNIEDLRTLYIRNLKKALDMERKITNTLPKMIEKSTDQQLATAFHNHLRQTEGHVANIESLLRKATGKSDTEACKAMSSLVTESGNSIKDTSNATIRDITLIASAQQMEHHEMAIYGTLRTWASILGLAEDARILDSILSEEKAADKLLSSISGEVNLQAAA
ncbi:YciE/YciF ferroxidase family protein [Edaphobacter albus]|uniref:YciE/YciF ferroxidase family protein n=1 Tax=Edaphobacter sp. 4G125 TaxID=2763071 RepID=UPI001646F9E4|nr:DUF892 family protein [Edaphobacter sp. 4G125]QNI37946.1 ferritin-like domain-containing protein [Edaphobacter sp. 4G125]